MYAMNIFCWMFLLEKWAYCRTIFKQDKGVGTNACTTRLTTPGRAVCLLRLRVLIGRHILGYKKAKSRKTWV